MTMTSTPRFLASLRGARGRSYLLAVARDDERGGRRENARERLAREPVASVESIGEDGDDVPAEGSKNVGQERGARDPVRVVVTEDADALAGTGRRGPGGAAALSRSAIEAGEVSLASFGSEEERRVIRRPRAPSG